MEKLLEWLVTAKDWNYVILEEKQKRSTEQNAYLWSGVYKTIADKMWETDLEYIHWVMGMKFLVDHSKKAPYIKSTAKLNTQQFTTYIEQIKDFVSQYWVIIPTAEEYRLLSHKD